MATVHENMRCWFYYDVTRPGVIENRICEGTDCPNAALNSEVTSLQVLVV